MPNEPICLNQAQKQSAITYLSPCASRSIVVYPSSVIKQNNNAWSEQVSISLKHSDETLLAALVLALRQASYGIEMARLARWGRGGGGASPGL